MNRVVSTGLKRKYDIVNRGWMECTMDCKKKCEKNECRWGIVCDEVGGRRRGSILGDGGQLYEFYGVSRVPILHAYTYLKVGIKW